MTETEKCKHLYEKCGCGKFLCFSVNKKIIDTTLCTSKNYRECVSYKE